MSPRFKGQWRPSLFKLMLMFSLALLCLALLGGHLQCESAARTARLGEPTAWAPPNAGQAPKPAPPPPPPRDQESDPMEPCYLANNRASESLTISESTPVGTVVGEIMVS